MFVTDSWKKWKPDVAAAAPGEPGACLHDRMQLLVQAVGWRLHSAVGTGSPVPTMSTDAEKPYWAGPQPAEMRNWCPSLVLLEVPLKHTGPGHPRVRDPVGLSTGVEEQHLSPSSGRLFSQPKY